ncbi:MULTISPECIES: M56 family metallopeptidase [Streptomycetaceae]|uniref:Putative integral membrane protein n=1 Tax=Streptantibioticus cattleyicolor (strain ATCC 35852 / DSM 46488 / JCM 4925 / NBRC 14057 / NRRL 8057) TaxID=1003195 RepID=F8JW40_STREN|nr:MULTISPECIES: M56 family metallopeptidase [Streptomycetaceae]AEW93208.1 putative integral membrane protein [Streptantibioticus cattleyicolor NRRL 8057 = DSM 46488]MYS57932.1 M48 family metalloprotease [Streptomyces sp. SID5468]CCB73571.1 Integral membrane protein [Streptantibioticus cattleyicolor NRRL 8057 = DSM 46488]
MTVPLVLLLIGALTAATAPRLLSRATWPDREPVLALWVWQCVVAAVLLCCALAMALCASAAWTAVRWHLFAPAPRGVVEAYALTAYGPWAKVVAAVLFGGGAWTVAMLTREVRAARAERRRRRGELRGRAPLLPGEGGHAESGHRLVILEGERPDAWWLPGPRPRLVVTTAALRRLDGRQLDALLAHEQGHARARHDWLRHCAHALAAGFPQVPVFAGFAGQVHRLVELAADDAASRRFGRLTTALALVGLNEDRGVFGPCPTALAQLPGRVDRLLDPAPRLPRAHRIRVSALALLLPAVPLLVTVSPALRALS